MNDPVGNCYLQCEDSTGEVKTEEEHMSHSVISVPSKRMQLLEIPSS